MKTFLLLAAVWSGISSVSGGTWIAFADAEPRATCHALAEDEISIERQPLAGQEVEASVCVFTTQGESSGPAYHEQVRVLFRGAELEISGEVHLGARVYLDISVPECPVVSIMYGYDTEDEAGNLFDYSLFDFQSRRPLGSGRSSRLLERSTILAAATCFGEAL